MNKLRFVLLLLALLLFLTACGYVVIEEMPVQIGEQQVSEDALLP